MSTKEQVRPIPVPTVDSKPFWESSKRHDLELQRCRSCAKFYFPPSHGCAHCGNIDNEWVKVSGKAKIYSWCTFQVPFVPYFTDDLPYASVVVEFEEAGGPRIISNVVDVKPDDLEIDMPLEIVYEDVSDDITLVKFKKASL